MVITERNGLDIPEHLNIEFFRNSLENGFSLSHVIIEKIEFSLATSGGDCYCSQIYRTKIRYSNGDESSTVSLIVKCILVVLSKSNIFARELMMYSKVLPVIEKMLVSQQIDKQICPRLIYSLEQPIKTFVFQDLNDLHLQLGNRNHGLDEDHSKIVLKKIGRFHAASMILARDDPNLIRNFNHSMFTNKSENKIRDALFRENIGDMAELVQKWDGFEDIARKLLKIKDFFYERVDQCEAETAAFKVLNHGDLWVNNFMFEHVNGRVVDLLLIDFQISYYASPAFDLHYFLNTSVELDVLITKRYELLRTYYMAFKSTLKLFEYENIPTWEELKNEMRAKEFIGFWAFEAILPLISMDKTASKDNRIEDFGNEEGARMKRQQMFTSERFLNTIKYSLDRLDELGVLD